MVAMSFHVTLSNDELESVIRALSSESLSYLLLSINSEDEDVRGGATIIQARFDALRDKLRAVRDEGPEDDGFVARASAASPDASPIVCSVRTTAACVSVRP